mgnify:CR=1 FL=1
MGQGDPDLSISDIYKLISNITDNKIININIFEIDSKHYWPKGWTNSDKQFDYGAPITSMALNSNENKYENINFLKSNIEKYMDNKFPYSKIRLVFGCGGERDKIKRAKMGEIASKYSDHIIITSDNPRSENPFTICSEIKKGCKKFPDA